MLDRLNGCGPKARQRLLASAGEVLEAPACDARLAAENGLVPESLARAADASLRRCHDRESDIDALIVYLQYLAARSK
jgi:hypothetical protein